MKMKKVYSLKENEFMDFLEEQREELKMTAAEFSRHIGVSKSSYSLWLAGKRKISFGKFMGCVRHLDVLIEVVNNESSNN